MKNAIFTWAGRDPKQTASRPARAGSTIAAATQSVRPIKALALVTVSLFTLRLLDVYPRFAEFSHSDRPPGQVFYRQPAWQERDMRLKRTAIALVTAVVAAGGFVADAAAHATIAHPTMNSSTTSITTLADQATTSLAITHVWFDM